MGVLGGLIKDIGVLVGVLVGAGVLATGCLRPVPGVVSSELVVLYWRRGVRAAGLAIGDVKTECILEILCRRLAERVVSFSYNTHG